MAPNRITATQKVTVTYEVPDLMPRIERGVALLDKKVPGWAEKINLGRLNMGNEYTCVVGQLAVQMMFEGVWATDNPYVRGTNSLFTAKQMEAEEDARHGFDLYRNEADIVEKWLDKQPKNHPWNKTPGDLFPLLYEHLAYLWHEVIAERQAA